MEIDLLTKTIKYYKKLITAILISTTCFVLIGSVIWLKLFPVYEGHAEIEIFPTQIEISLSKELSSVVSAIPSTAITKTYTDVSLSRIFAEKAITDLKKKTFFERRKPLSLSETLYNATMKPIISLIIKSYYYLNYGEFSDLGPFEIQVRKLIKHTTITPEPGSYLVNINVIWDDPRTAAEAANIIANLYIERSIEDNRKASLEVRKFIERKIKETQHRLDKINNEIFEYKKQERIISLPEQGITLIEYIADYEKQLNNTKVKLTAQLARKKKLEQELVHIDERILTGKTIINNPVIQELESKLANEKIKLSSLLEEYKNNNRGSKFIGATKRKIANIKKEINDQVKKLSDQETIELNPTYQELSKLLIFLNAEVISLMAQEKQIKSALSVYQDRGETIPHKEKKLSELIRAKDTIEASLGLLNKKYQEARIAEISKLSSIRIKDIAIPPIYPKHPMVLVNLLLSIPMGALISLFVIMFNEFKNVKIRTVEDLKQVTELPLIGTYSRLGPVTMSKNNGNNSNHTLKPYHRIPFDTYLEPYDMFIRNSSTNGVGKAKAFLFVSSTSDTPKSRIIANLANKLSGYGRRVLVIDANFFAPRMSRIFNINENHCPRFKEMVMKKLPYRQSVYKVKENLDVLLGESTDSAQVGSMKNNRLIDLEYLSSLIEETTKEYHHVLIDSTPLFNGIGADLMMKYADEMVFIMKSGTLSKNEFNAVEQRLSGGKANVLGIIISE